MLTRTATGYDLTTGTIYGEAMSPAMLNTMAETLSSDGMQVVYNEKGGNENSDQKYYPPPTKPEQITGIPGPTQVKSPTKRKRWKDKSGIFMNGIINMELLKSTIRMGKKILESMTQRRGSKPSRQNPDEQLRSESTSCLE